MCLTVVLLVFGITALIKGEFNVTNELIIKGVTGRLLGIVLLAGAASSFFTDYSGIIQVVVLIGVIIAGLLKSEKIESSKSSENSQVDLMSIMNLTTNLVFRWIIPIGLLVGLIMFFFQTIGGGRIAALEW